jgi:PAS domain-containing protein
MATRSAMDLDQAYSVSLVEHLVVPTFVLNPARHVVIWNRACERLTGVAASKVIGADRHWQAFYNKKRHCLADLVVMAQPDKLAELYPEHSISNDGLILLSQKTSESKSRGRPLRRISYGLGFVHQRGLGWISNR